MTARAGISRPQERSGFQQPLDQPHGVFAQFLQTICVEDSTFRSDSVTCRARTGRCCMEYFRPNFFTNTPDILPLHLQSSEPWIFKARVVSRTHLPRR